jgi:hypothetical protein
MDSAGGTLAGGFPHSDISGSLPVCRLPEAFRRLPRPSSPVIAKASTTCTCSLDPIALNARYRRPAQVPPRGSPSAHPRVSRPQPSRSHESHSHHTHTSLRLLAALGAPSSMTHARACDRESGPQIQSLNPDARCPPGHPSRTCTDTTDTALCVRATSLEVDRSRQSRLVRLRHARDITAYTSNASLLPDC